MRILFAVYSLVLLSTISFAQNKDETVINFLVNNWHKAAAQANAHDFFGFMADDCIYIGTDETERWTKNEFVKFAKPYFDRGKAWDFEPIERQVYFSKNKKTAWFNETLNTWMGVCRSSGVLVKKKGKWKLKHYHLSVTVPNDKIKEFIRLLGVEPPQHNE
ncbi:MAG: nuclear transport factor 2 family protein [Bacteroidales bacterium]|nr:nuclear transport factor 2 family protein [Bacteroidales bacterium]